MMVLHNYTGLCATRDGMWNNKIFFNGLVAKQTSQQNLWHGLVRCHEYYEAESRERDVTYTRARCSNVAYIVVRRYVKCNINTTQRHVIESTALTQLCGIYLRKCNIIQKILHT